MPFVTNRQVDHYQGKITNMLSPQIELVKLALQDRRYKLVEKTKKSLVSKLGINSKIKKLEQQENDYHAMKRHHEKEREECEIKKDKLDKELRKFIGSKSSNKISLSSHKLSKRDIEDAVNDLAEDFAEVQSKTMPEFSKLNKLKDVRTACQDIVIESGTPDELNAKLSTVLHQTVGIVWNRHTTLAIAKQ